MLSPVFVETIRSKAKSGKVYETCLVRESVRTPQGPRSRTICNISGLPPETRQAVADSLKSPLKKAPRLGNSKNPEPRGGAPA